MSTRRVSIRLAITATEGGKSTVRGVKEKENPYISDIQVIE
jgi:hypothetical protein